ncbi:MAG: pyridoxamine 5'-phosphate oxidase family protein [Candidatus Latescibacteria bacterium]|jgi:hypothetical protein|nr:pyridoxamine 5'-phosphate oxidase family protein [Candidatus Latescibacterota bacterium]MBT5832327.1 pyridoxamine 5'-phosphate oxidase family protein [Candidatus Latescibacterota bacterium]
MAKFYDALDDKLTDFINKQHIFFTTTAPEEGRINLSPKGMDTFTCLNSTQVAYLNLTGSGNETAAHLTENNRITIMFCSFAKNPLILRIYGKGRSIHPSDSEWENLSKHIEPIPGARQYIVIDIDSVQTSCGYAVPHYDYTGERDTLRLSAERKGETELETYRRDNNLVTIDGKPTGYPVNNA